MSDGPRQENDDIVKILSYEQVVNSSNRPPTPPPSVSYPVSATSGAGTNKTGARTSGPGIFTIENRVTRENQRDNRVQPSPKDVVADQPLPFYTHEFDDADQKVAEKPCLPPQNDILSCIGIISNFGFFFISMICRRGAQEDFDAGRNRCGKVRAVLAFVFFVLTFLTPVAVTVSIVILHTVL